MGGICVVSSLDSHSANSRVLKRMTDHIKQERDYSRWYVDEHVGLSSTKPHHPPDKVEFTFDGSMYLVASDGRIDNAPQIAREIRECGHVLNSCTEEEVIAAAFHVWGHSCVSQMLGDFAFAIWSSSSCEMFIARSPSGCRPLYYSFTNGRFVCSSMLQSLFLCPGTSMDLDDRWVANWLARSDPHWHMTPFRSVKQLPPGHRMVVHNRDVKCDIFWMLESIPKLQYRRKEEYGEHLRSLKCAPEFEPPIELIDGLREAVVSSPSWRRYHGQTNPSPKDV